MARNVKENVAIYYNRKILHMFCGGLIGIIFSMFFFSKERKFIKIKTTYDNYIGYVKNKPILLSGLIIKTVLTVWLSTAVLPIEVVPASPSNIL